MKRRLLSFLLLAVVALGCLVPSAAYAAQATVVTDDVTMDSWKDLIADNTANVGRIWTDKSVSSTGFSSKETSGEEVTKKEGSDFVTGLTALSSTSNLVETASSPLDIVLVLDMSSSMTQRMGNTTKLQALKDAANEFVDEIASQNEKISDANNKHQIALVSYNSKATINQGLTICSGSDATSLKTTINNLSTSTYTRSDLGLSAANSALGIKRENAKQVVIFFTDGTPTQSQNFDATIASAAVSAASSMKEGGATIYTIGVLSGADPSIDPTGKNVSNENKFLHAVSSNYPKATYNGTIWSFDERAEDSEFYLSAENADELKEIFKKISDEISHSAGYPTETTDDSADTSGYITFNDQLGAYMEVTDLSTLIYNGTTYSCKSKDDGGSVVTYHFEGDVHSGAADANLSSIVITVTKSSDLSVGDKVQVKIPASLIPLRNFKVDLTKETMSVTDTKPISIFYSSALKSGVSDKLENPDDAMKAYILANSDSDGNVKFYANTWSDEQLGETTSHFNPADTNSYYYFTQDTPIYTDKDCSVPAKEIVKGTSYHYQHTYYVLEGNKPVKMTESLTFDGDTAAAFEGCIGYDGQGNAYFVKGTARLVYINQLHKAKEHNYTGTAADVLNPKWNTETSVADAKTVTPHLGNNGLATLGKATYDSASLDLSKVLEGRDWLESDSFTFKLEAVTEGAPMPKDAEGNEVNEATVSKADVKEGKAGFDFGTFTFYADSATESTSKTYEYKVTEVIPAESDRIAGITYSRAEAEVSLTVTSDDSGKLRVNPFVSIPTFTNSYKASLNYTSSGSLNIAKTLTGRDMSEDQFSVAVVPSDEASANALGITTEGITVAIPASGDGTQVVVDALSGRKVVFTQDDAGKTYTYKVYETGEATSGYTYDKTVRTVKISVADNPEQAALTVTTKVSGNGKEQTYVYPSEDKSRATVAFSNFYSASTDADGGTAASVTATKTLTGRAMVAGEFSFGLRLDKAETDILNAKNDANGTVSFGSLNYTTSSLAKLVEDGFATKGLDKESGKTKWTIGYEIYENTDGLSDRGITAKTTSISFTVTVLDNGNGTLRATANAPDGGFKFENVYGAKSATVNVSGKKELSYDSALSPADITGKFSFTIAADTSNPKAPLPTQTTVTNDKSGNVDFGGITFTLEDLNNALGTTSEQSGDDSDVDLEGTESADVQTPVNEPVVEDEPVAEDEQNLAEGSETAADSSQSESEAQSTDSNSDSDGAESAEQLAAEPLSLIDDTPVLSENFSTSNDDADTEGSVAQPAAFIKAVSLFKLPQLSTIWRAGYQTLTSASAASLTKTEPVSRSYTFKYTVTESGAVSGVTNDSTSKTVSITVTDDGAGHLTAKLEGEDSKPAFSFTNTYNVKSVDSSVTGQVTIAKELDGRDMVADEFSFEMLEGNTVVATGTNDANGNVTLSSITYDKPGKHSYTVREVAGEDGNGITYDGTTFTINTVVSDNGDGTLSVTHKRDGKEEIVFNNTYKAASTSIVIGASKVLNGGKLADGQFTFKLVGGGIELTAKNKADGTVSFPTIPFEQAGTYTFDVYEVNDGQANVTYDATHHTVTVKVSDDGKGNLVADITSEEGSGLTFTNTYTAPEPDPTPSSDETPTGGSSKKKAIPQTGDVSAAPVAVFAAAGIVVLAAAIKMRGSRK